VGTAGNDVICGEGGGDVLITGGGNDTVIGGDGFDFVSLEDASGGGTIDLNAGTATAPGMTATLQDIEGGIGTAFADTLTGNGDDNDFLGLGGDDSIDGGSGFDFVRYDFATKRIRANLAQEVATGDGTDSVISFEGFIGGPKDDVASGNGKPNILVGLKGDDLLQGLAKPDGLFGGPGADDLFGGGGNDDLFGGPGADSCNVGPGGGSISSC
jgi:Ca2+-binding RTX toxin-like protein